MLILFITVLEPIQKYNTDRLSWAKAQLILSFNLIAPHLRAGQ